MLESTKLTLDNIYNIIKRLLISAQKNRLDKSVVECAKVIGCVVECSSGTFKKQDEYLISVLSYLCGVVNDVKNYVFLDIKDMKEILNSIKKISVYMRNKKQKFFAGVYANAYDVIYKYNIIRACLEEDILCLSANLGLLVIMYKITYYQGLRTFIYQKMYGDMLNIQYSKPINMPVEKYREVMTVLIKYKYMFMNMISTKSLLKESISMKMLINDILLCGDLQQMFEILNKFVEEIKMDEVFFFMF